MGEDGNFASKYFYQKKAWAVINVVRNRNEHFLQRIGQNNFGEVKRNNFSQIDISAKLVASEISLYLKIRLLRL